MSRCAVFALAPMLWLGACGDDVERARLADASDGAPAEPNWMNGGEDIPEYSLARLLIARADAPELVLFDLDTNAIAGRLPFEARANVHSGPGGRYGYAVGRAAGGVRIVEPGQWLLSHIDHFHVLRGAYALLPEQLTVAEPSCFGTNDGWISVYDSRSASVSFFQERSITARTFAPGTVVVGAAPQAGVALISHAQLLASDASNAAAPVITQRSALDPTAVLASFACSEPSAIAAHEQVVFVACKEGLLRLGWSEAQQTFAGAVEPTGSADERITRLCTSPKLSGVLLDAGKSTLLIAKEDGSALTRVPFSSEVLDFAVHRAGRVGVVLTRDGLVHELSLETGMLTRSARALEPLAPPSGAHEDVPRVALSHAYAYVADSRRRDIVALRLRSFEVEQQLAIDGAPFDVALVGMPPQYTDARE